MASILSNIGKTLEKIFVAGSRAARLAEPFVDTVYPGIGPLFNAVVDEAVKAESLAIAAGQQNGTGPQKLASVVSAVEPNFTAFAKANNIAPLTTAQIESAVSLLVGFLNSIPSVPAHEGTAVSGVVAGAATP